MGEHVEFPSGDGGGGPTRGYLATPVDGGAGPALIVLGPLLGLEAHTTTVCDRFAAEGFTALAPQESGEVGPGDDPQVLGLNVPATIEMLQGATAFLEEHPEVHGQGVGAVGFEAGALLALTFGAGSTADVKAIVVFDGPILDEVAADSWTRLEAPVECHLGAQAVDHLRDRADALLAAARERQHSVDVFTYPGAAPGFFDGTRPDVHDADAAHEAWIRTLSFLRAHLG